MRKIAKPIEAAIDSYNTCISMVKNADLRQRLKNAVQLIVDGEDDFADKVTTGTLMNVPRENILNKNLTKKEMEKVYTFRMAKKGSTGRAIYNKILSSAPLGVCPLCSHREATTLDHYLPKTQYPRLTVTPINLLPCCKDCNDIKDKFYPSRNYEELIHPYFDDVETDTWLKAAIIDSSPISCSFSVEPPPTWPLLLRQRIEFHFKKLNLGKLYSIQAAVELSMLKKQLQATYKKAGVFAVKTYFMESADSRAEVNPNSWQTAFYFAAFQTDWFCDGGFNR